MPRPRSWERMARDAEVVHEDREHRCVASLTGTDKDDQRPPAPVDEMMDLGAQTPA